MTATWVRHLTWSRIGLVVCVGLIAFGTLVAVLPHNHPAAEPTPMSAPDGQPNAEVAVVSNWELAAQQQAVEFVTACDTTDPAHPTGDVATETALAPNLAVPHHVTWPAVWTAEDRRTTVVLDPPGQPVTEPDGNVTVIVTGIMTITSTTITSDTGSSEMVPVAEKVTLRPSSAGRDSSGWLVTGIKVGA